MARTGFEPKHDKMERRLQKTDPQAFFKNKSQSSLYDVFTHQQKNKFRENSIPCFDLGISVSFIIGFVQKYKYCQDF
ncbi:MAG: hypothetical protein UT30_C0031G0009 [Candidatus Uhrbacteria bacterium GW2011_GWF2_39_13]|uniref:Uncharacterized protein n=1 Tax=Candidatus Uhrbacteria bacterium GW2011_GWF2_39_13 TaxID=1618995 RepID=A0A0G0MJN4_9BACT|nr:MAG: hypothetical protein UT30_C0031G0009 [Candidatus Uhrbacteria bacterium GW2011_GWF2_39_13]